MQMLESQSVERVVFMLILQVSQYLGEYWEAVKPEQLLPHQVQGQELKY